MPHLRRPDEGTPERLPRRASALPAVRQVREMSNSVDDRGGVVGTRGTCAGDWGTPFLHRSETQAEQAGSNPAHGLPINAPDPGAILGGVAPGPASRRGK